ncbi:ATPase family AAA domain-containing protein 2 isoform X1 [Electrophorus electricus]|uniref:ATPase family AAA domain-containing protein 2 isoform X1 n=1 Tax=Electrophorus electricus TaxID=8005 RepID=UPI0015D00B55|nr:ATPase family AAA domain-containing protein 2 isoform X1 [Electrophorus electricus]
MVMLRSSRTGANRAAAARAPDMDSSSEFLSLRRPLRKSARLKGLDDDSFSSAENTPANGYLSVKEENSIEMSGIRTRAQNGKGVKFADMSNQPNGSPQKEDKSLKHLRKSSRLQTDGEKSGDEHSVMEKVGGMAGSRNLRSHFPVRKETAAVRRSSRIIGYKLNARNQSVLYDRLITNTAEAVLQKMDDMQKMRRRLRSRDVTEENLRRYSGVKRKGTTRSTVRTNEESADDQGSGHDEYTQEDENDDNEDDDDREGVGEEDDNDDEEEEDEEEEDNQKRYDFRQRKAVIPYQAPLDEPRKQSIFFRRHSTPISRRYSFRPSGPCSPYSRHRSSRRRHAIHSSDSTSSSSSDDERFDRRRSNNRNRSANRSLPINFRKDDLLGIHKDRIKVGASLADVDPMRLDHTVRFDSIGGLSRHISALKEMVVFPLLYPEVFERFKIQPPRGCLFYGPPGTGKTLVARALANECSQGDKKVAFFMRKGADCLSKWVGESERQLRLLFDQAYQMRPSIIFFDEIDGIAPVRSSRQDQIHSSIVSTLLALMDGLDARGEVVVIGATNRLDSIDPALRRPGRFDREFLFSLPDREARKEILKIHTRQWSPQLSEAFLEELADKCVGYCGADLKAVCAEAALCALRRRYPQIYASSQKLLLDVASISVRACDFLSAMRRIVPSSQRAVGTPAKALAPAVRPLLAGALGCALEALLKLFPHAEQGIRKRRDHAAANDDMMSSDDDGSSLSISNNARNSTNVVGSFLHLKRSALQKPTSFRPRLLLCGRPGSGQSSHLAPAMLHTLEKLAVYTLDLAVLYGVSATSPEEACAQVFCEAMRTAPSVLYVPHIQRWWETVSLALRATFLSLLQGVPSFSPILLLATCSLPYGSLPPEVQDMFCMEYGEVFDVPLPSEKERHSFFEDLILNQAAKVPVSKRDPVHQMLDILPVAPPPPPRKLSEQEQQKLEEQEEDTLRELRLFLRDVTNRLAQDKRFKAFAKPVDTEEVPDYTTVIKQPMDLSTVLTKIDLHRYVTVKDFLHDVDLIWKNALEYNPDRDPSDRLIRHRACALKDTVHAIIKDELDEDFEKICVEIKESRMRRGCFVMVVPPPSLQGCTTSRFTPSYYHVLPKVPASAEAKTSDPAPAEDKACVAATGLTTPKQTGGQRKRRRRKLWSNGFVPRKKFSQPQAKDANGAESTEEEEEDEMEGKAAGSEGGGRGREGKDVEPEAMDTEGEERSPAPTEDAKGVILTQNGHASSREGDDDDDVPTASALELFQGDAASQGVLDSYSSGGSRDSSELHPVEITDANRVEPSAEADGGIANGTRHITRALKKHAQHQFLHIDVAMNHLEQRNQPLIVQHDKLQELLQKVVALTEGYEVDLLEKLYALLCQSIYRHRREYDKTALIQEMCKEVEDFSNFST